MIFEQENIVFEILDVMYLNLASSKLYNYGRNFDALSFRYEADTLIETEKNQIAFEDNTVGYFPSNVSYTRISKKDKLIVVHFKAFNYHSETIEKFVPQDPGRYRVLFEEMLNCWNNKGVAYKNECSSLLYKIFAELYKDNKPAFKNEKLSASVEYIDKNYTKRDFSLKTAASKSFMSETYFRKLFKQTFGVSPKRYVIEHRIKYAEGLILSGYFQLQEVSEFCGYNDYKHFSVEFKKITGVSPSEFNYNYNYK